MKLRRTLQSLNIQHPGHTLDGAGNFIQMFYVKDFHGHFNAAFLIRTD